MVYELLEKLPNVTKIINSLIVPKPLNFDEEVILFFSRKKSIGYQIK